MPRNTPAVPFELQSLEARCLLSGEPWGAFPRLIDLDAARNSFPNITGAGQTIAILDTGVDYSLDELGGGFGAGRKVIAGYDFVNNDGNPDDPDGHGTATASLAAGGDFVYQGSRYSGVAPDANIVALRIDDGSGNIPQARYEAALQWVIAHRVQYNIVAVNISEGGDAIYPDKTDAGSSYSDELQQLHDAGVVIAVSSGNDGVTNPLGVEYPAADPGAFAIGSLTLDDKIASHTTRGDILDLLAPGQSVPAVFSFSGQAVVLAADGTSFASPYVAGAAALIKQINANFSADQVVAILKQSGKDVYDPATGLTFTRIDLDNALSTAYAWSGSQRIPIGDDASEVSIAYGANGKLYAAWYDAVAQSLDYAVRSANGVWSQTQIVDESANVGRWPSLAVDSKGNPNIAYYDATNLRLKYAHWNGSSWKVRVVDSAGKTGLHPSLAFSAAAMPGISYYDATNDDLRFATWGKKGWVRKRVDGQGDSGKYSSIAYNAKTDRFAIAYERTTGGLFRYAEQSASNSWVLKTVDDTVRGGGHISLAFNSSWQPAFSYYDSYRADLKFAQRSGSTWSKSSVATSGKQGLYTTLLYDQDGPNIAFYNQSSDSVWLANGGIGHWSLARLITSAGSGVAGALNSNDTLTIAFFQNGSNALHFEDF